MKIAITGSSGYIGKNLTKELGRNGYQIVSIPRHLLYADSSKLVDLLSGTKAVINLAGSPVLQRWTSVNRKVIYNSRVITTRNICNAINGLADNEKPSVFISASAVGVYQPQVMHDEDSSNLATNFLGRLVMDWEAASLQLDDNVRRVVFRTGIVIGKDAKMIKSLYLPFKLWLGGRLGSGNQPFPFIHIDDVVNAYVQAIDDDLFEGAFNLVAPEQINNKQFSYKFAKYLNRPAWLRVPQGMLKLFYGEAAEMVFYAPFVIPRNLEAIDFSFRYPDIDSALLQIVT